MNNYVLYGFMSIHTYHTFIGTPKGQLSVNEIIEAACQEAEVYRDCGVDGVMVENMHDGPYLRGSVGPEITACMTRVCAEVGRVTKDVPVGVQILSGKLMSELSFSTSYRTLPSPSLPLPPSLSLPPSPSLPPSLSLLLSLLPSPSLPPSFTPGANKEALAVAKASGACFIRTESFVFSHVADEGWMDSCAAELLRYRRAIGAEDILVFTDIKKKHW